MGDMMSFDLEYIFAAVLCTQCLAGIVVNLVISTAIFVRWKTLRSLQTYYKILICLTMSRSLTFLNLIFWHLMFMFYPWITLDMVMMVAITIKTTMLSYINLWFATVLCVFYCVKIVNYNCKIWIFLKMKISTGVSWFLLASFLLSIAFSLPFGFYVFDLEPKNGTKGTMVNATAYNNEFVLHKENQFLIFLLGSCPPFLIFCIATCLLLQSLWRHTRHMRSSGSGFQSPNFEPHLSAVKSMSLFLVLQIIYFILLNLVYSGRLYNYEVWRVLGSILTCTNPLVHSLYIIFSNTEIKKTCALVFSFARDTHC